MLALDLRARAEPRGRRRGGSRRIIRDLDAVTLLPHLSKSIRGGADGRMRGRGQRGGAEGAAAWARPNCCHHYRIHRQQHSHMTTMTLCGHEITIIHKFNYENLILIS